MENSFQMTCENCFKKAILYNYTGMCLCEKCAEEFNLKTPKAIKEEAEAYDAKLNKIEKEIYNIEKEYETLSEQLDKYEENPSKLRDIVYEMCDFFDKYETKGLKRTSINRSAIALIKEWKKVLKPIKG